MPPPTRTERPPQPWHGRLRASWRALTPPQLFVGSFLLLVGLGTVGFKTLPGLYMGEELGWLDALFTATSAVCVTGLIVVDTATYFTTAGQGYILLLIQLGGLGIVTFTSAIILALGFRLSLRQETLAASPSPHTEIDYRSLTRSVVLYTFLFEGAGALLLFLCWLPAMAPGEAAWTALFHAVSAFCNAGFSTFSDSLMGFQRHLPLQVVVMALIVAGGLGFLSLEELYRWRRSRRLSSPLRRFNLSLHTRLVLVTTAALIAGGWVLFTVLEWTVTLGEMPVWARLLNGLFLSVTARTAGFNTVDYGQASDGANFLTILLMSIGGSPGSTAGGLKTTTFALIGLIALARLRGHDLASAWSRSIPPDTAQRAVGLFVLGFGLVTAAIFLFTTFEIKSAAHPEVAGGFLPHMFEAVSAFNTVGLSMGVTGGLTAFGKWTTIALMFVGRVGPLTVAAALARRRAPTAGRVRYAYEDVVIG